MTLRSFLLPVLIASLAAVLFLTKIQREMADFAVYRTAGARALEGTSLYRATDGHYQFKYLPAFALAMAPVALLGVDAAKAVWFALTIGLLTAYLRWTVRGLPARNRSERALLWLALLFMAKFLAHELTLGQTNILLGTLLVGALLSVQAEVPLVAGALIGAAVFVKPYAAICLPWLALVYGWRPTAVAGGVIGLGLTLPVVAFGWPGNLAQLDGWWTTVAASTAPNLLSADNISLAALWAKWLGPGRAATALTTLSIGALLAAAGLTWSRRHLVEEPDYLEFALLMVLIPLLSPQGWDYVLLLSAPAVVLLLDRWPDLDRPWRYATGAALGLMCFTIFDVMGRSLYARFMALSIVTPAAMMVVVALARLRWRGRA